MALLNDLLNSQSEYLTPENIIQIVLDIGNAVKSLHSFSIIHGDVSLNSIFIASLCKVSDRTNTVHSNNLSLSKF